MGRTGHPETGAVPLVSCILPTRSRSHFLAQAVCYFLDQDYPHRELIIIDDGLDPSALGLTKDQRIRHLRIPPGLSLGAKRNFGCEQSRGSILAQWDDDDWYHPGRLTAQVQPLLENEADITALETDLFFDLQSRKFWRCSARVHRGLFPYEVNPRTLVLERGLWERTGGYPEVDLGEDSLFLQKILLSAARLKNIPGRNLFIYLRHADNVSSFRCGESMSPGDWYEAPAPALPERDRVFYEQQARRYLTAPDTTATGNQIPLVSCLLLTADRRRFLPLAIKNFLNQDYPEKELLVLDDGMDAVSDLMPQDPRIRYMRLAGKASVGAKRNLACQEAHGELMAHWDDDDWMAPWRLSYQVSQLLEAGADICGLDRLYYWGPGPGQAWEYIYPKEDRPWVAGGTMLYTKELWRSNRFADANVGEDNLFVWSDHPKKILHLKDQKFYVALIHRSNTSPKYINADRWFPCPVKQLQEMMGEDWHEYLDLVSEPISQNEQARDHGPGPMPAAVSGLPTRKGPMISCVMATGGRASFVRQTIQYFLRQSYRNAELIVVDNGTAGVEELCSGLLPVRYVYAAPEASLGAKLNLGISHARGRILQKIDDDDIYHPLFLECSVEMLRGVDRVRSIAAWDCFLVHVAGDRNLRFSGHGWAAGGTLCFYREVAERTQFRDVHSKVDHWFLTDSQASVRRVCMPELYVLVRHGNNTWQDMSSGEPVSDYFRRLPPTGVLLDNVIEPIDLPFYQILAKGEKPE